MTTNELAHIYAQTLYDLANAINSVDAIDENLQKIAATVAENIDLREALSDASITPEAKQAIASELFKGFAPEAIAIATVAIERGGAEGLFSLQKKYVELANANRAPAKVEVDATTVIEGKPVVADIVTALPLDEATRVSLTKKLTSAMRTPVLLRESIDKSIIGGIRITIGDRVLDGTVSSQLEAMRNTLSEAFSGGEA